MAMWVMRRCGSAKLGGEIPQASRERDEHGVRELRAQLDEREERLATNRLQRAIGLGRRVGDAHGRGVDERGLAEDAAAAQTLDRLPADRDAHAALEYRI